MTRVFCPCIRQSHTKEEAAHDGTSCRPVTQHRALFLSLFPSLLESVFVFETFRVSQQTTWKIKKKTHVEAYSCPCPANKLRVSSLRWPPQDEQPKKGSRREINKKQKEKVDGGPVKNVAKLPAKEFAVYFEIPNVTSSRLPKKISNHLTNKHEQTKCTRKEEKEPPAESIYAHVYSITSNGIKEKKRKKEKSRKNR